MYEIRSKVAQIFTSRERNDTGVNYVMPFSERRESGKISVKYTFPPID